MSAKRYCAAAAALMMAGAAGATDLLQAWQIAQTADPVLAAARHSLRMAGEKVPQARAGLLPTINFNAGASRQSGAASFDGAPDVQREPRSRNWSVQLAQPLYKPAHWAALQQAEAQLRQAGHQYRLAEQDAIVRLAQAYFDVLVAQESAAVAHAQGAAMGQQLKLAQRNFEVGMTTVTDIHEAQSRFQLARAQQVVARSELAQKQAELEKILGQALPQPASLRADAALPAPATDDAQHWIRLAQQQHPEVLLQQAAAEAAQLELARQRAGHAPSLELTASRNASFNSGSLATPADTRVRSLASQVGVQLTVPLYAGGAVAARVREALAAQDKAQAELLAAQRKAAAQASQSHAAWLQGGAQAEALAAAVAASRSQVEASQIGYRIGTRINIDVLNAQQQLHAAQRDLFKARADTLLHSLRLKAAIGELHAGDLQAVNQLLVASAAGTGNNSTTSGHAP
ncbi:MAG: TolC family outer membrane protein [Ramlibacter sp.]